MKIVHFVANIDGSNGMANTARQFVAEELARGDESVLTNETAVIERSEKIDRVHIHGTWLPVLWKVAKLAKRKGAELIVRPCGNYDPIRIRRGAISRLKKWLAGPFEHAMLNRADFVQCTCPAEAEWVKAYHSGARIQMTDLKRFFRIDADGPGPSVRTRMNGELHVLYLGRLDPLKGVRYLQQAVAELNASSSTSFLHLRTVSDHFGEQLERDWEWCDVLCLPTLSENFGRVIAEALERGKAVITTDGAPAWDCGGDRLIYIRGFRDGSDDFRVSSLVAALDRCRLVGRGFRAAPHLVTIGIKCLNLEQYIGEAIRSAFEQTYRPLEIVISDDGSTDSTWRVVEESVRKFARDDVNVVLNRNPVNLGNCGNWEKICSFAKGEWIFKFDGDDISEPTRVERIMSRIAPGDMSASSACELIALDGHRVGVRAATPADEAFGAVMAFHRATYDRFPRVSYPRVMDDVVWKNRARMLGTHCRVDERLVRYRLGSGVVGAFANTRAGIRVCNRTAIDESEQLRIDAAGKEEWMKKADEMRERAIHMDKLLNGGSLSEKLAAIRSCSRGKSFFGKTFLWLCLIPGPVGDALIFAFSYLKRKVLK